MLFMRTKYQYWQNVGCEYSYWAYITINLSWNCQIQLHLNKSQEIKSASYTFIRNCSICFPLLWSVLDAGWGTVARVCCHGDKRLIETIQSPTSNLWHVDEAYKRILQVAYNRLSRNLRRLGVYGGFGEKVRSHRVVEFQGWAYNINVWLRLVLKCLQLLDYLMLLLPPGAYNPSARTHPKPISSWVDNLEGAPYKFFLIILIVIVIS